MVVEIVFDRVVLGTIIGLIIIAIAWLLQLMSSWNGDKSIRKRFIILNNIGAAWLVIANFYYGNYLIAVFNLFVLIIASILLGKVGKNDKPVKTAKKRKR